MGQFYYSTVKAKGLTPIIVQKDLEELNEVLWPDGRYKVERVSGVPMGKQDDRAAQWCFQHSKNQIDAAFSLALLKDGRFEFKVPRSNWDSCWEDQQRIRRRLVRRYNLKR